MFESTSVRSKGAALPLVAGTQLTVGFRDGQLSASGGCNSMGGTFRFEGDVLQVEDLMTTEMACSPPERMTQDEWLARALRSSPHVRLDGSRLELAAPEATIVFLDRKVTEPDRPLVATHWVVDTVVAGPIASNVPAGADPPFLDFAADGTFRGFSGCAPLTGRFAIEGARLVLEDVIVANASACTVDGERLNGTTKAVLSGTVTFEIEGLGLRLTNGETGLHLRAA